MATIIDTLVVELGLDPKKLTQGQQQALASFKKTQEEALKSGKAVERAAERVQQYLGKIRNQAVGFAAATFGATGIVQFIQQVTTANAALGRSAELLGTSEEKLSVWRGAVKLAGGTAEGMQQTIAGLVNSFSRFGVTGEIPESARWFQGLGLAVADVTTGKLKPFDQIIDEISEKLSKMDKVEGATWARGLGIEESIIPFVLKGPAAMRAFREEMEKANKVTKEAATKSAELEQDWVRTSENAKGFGNELVTSVSPALSSALRFYNNWFSNLRTLVGTVGGGDLRAKSDAGTPSVAVHALASSLQNSVPGLKEFTSFNDPFHAGMKSKHSQGLALDFTVNDPSKYAETAAAVRRRLTEMGVEAYVRDEHNDPSPYATGSHIHVQFANAAAASKFTAASGAGGAAAIANAGGGAGARTSVTNIGEINIVVPGGDAAEIARNIDPQIKRRGDALSAQTGAN